MKKVNKLLFIAGLLMCFAFSACKTFRADGLAFYSFDQGYESLGTFSKKATVHEFLGTSGGPNLFNISSTAMSDKAYAMIAREVEKKGGNAARNVTIQYSVNPFQLFFNTITEGIWAPATLVVSGEVIRVNTNGKAYTENQDTIIIIDPK